MKFSFVLVTLAATAAQLSYVHALPQAYDTQMSYGQAPVAQAPAPVPTIVNDQGVNKTPCGCKGGKGQPEPQDDNDVDTPPSSVNVKSLNPEDTPAQPKAIPTPVIVQDVKPYETVNNPTPVEVKAVPTVPCDKENQVTPPVVDVQAVQTTEPCADIGVQAAPTIVIEPTNTPCSESASVQPTDAAIQPTAAAEATPCPESAVQPTVAAVQPTDALDATPCPESAVQPTVTAVQPTDAVDATPCPESAVQKIAAVPQTPPTPIKAGSYEFPVMSTAIPTNSIAAQSAPEGDNTYVYNAASVGDNNTTDASTDSLIQTSSGHKINASIMAIIAVGAGFIAL